MSLHSLYMLTCLNEENEPCSEFIYSEKLYLVHIRMYSGEINYIKASTQENTCQVLSLCNVISRVKTLIKLKKIIYKYIYLLPPAGHFSACPAGGSNELGGSGPLKTNHVSIFFFKSAD